MGKLHTLRREIKRDPDEWYRQNRNGVYIARGARRTDNGFKPATWRYRSDSHKDFIRDVLINECGVGQADKWRGNTAR